MIWFQGAIIKKEEQANPFWISISKTKQPVLLCFCFCFSKNILPTITSATYTWHRGGSVPVDMSLEEEREEIT